MNHAKYRFFEDPEHGWLEVPRSEVEVSGIDVTPCSYYDSQTDTVYLEEDVDMVNFLKVVGKDHIWRECISTTIHNSRPRNLPSYYSQEAK